MEGLDFGLFVFAGLGDGAGFGFGDRVLGGGHGFAEGGDGFYCRIGASEGWRGAEEGAGCGEEAGGGTEKGGHCGDRVRRGS